jgi:uncharacterized protein YukE
MGIAKGMQDLTQNIASSRQDRAKRIGEIKGETGQLKEGTKDLLQGFQASRRELNSEIKEASAAWQGLSASKTKNKKAKSKEGGAKRWEPQPE